MRVALVGCSKSKLDRPMPAKDLYTGHLFKAARVYAEAKCDGWFILSAKHGLLGPQVRVEPYDLTLRDFTPREHMAWAHRVEAAIRLYVPQDSTLVFLAGARYRDWLEIPLSRRYRLELPLKGLGIGQQKAKLKEMAA